jgi:hypothetical protein
MMAGALAPCAVAFADDDDAPSSPAAWDMRSAERGLTMSGIGEVRAAEMGKVLGGVKSKYGLILVHDGNLASMPQAVLDMRKRR